MVLEVVEVGVQYGARGCWGRCSVWC